MLSRMFHCIFLLFSWTTCLIGEESFLLINGHTNEKIIEVGSDVDVRFSPCSTFKIVLSLMGYDAGILVDADNPVWNYEAGYDDWLETWRKAQSPSSWMKDSCIWYSKILSIQLGLESIKKYIHAFDYGNRNVSGGLTKPEEVFKNPFWINSTLHISPRGQVEFIRKMVLGELGVSSAAFQATKTILFKEEIYDGWNLLGKTGWSGLDISKDGKTIQFSWFVGWIEKSEDFYPFAYFIRAKEIDLEKRVPRVIELIMKEI